MNSERLDAVADAYCEDEISETELDELLDAIIADSPPYLADRILCDPNVRRHAASRMLGEPYYIYYGDLLVLDGNIARVAETKEVDTEVETICVY